MKIKIVNHSKNNLPRYETDNSVGMDLRAWVNSPFTKTVTNSFVQARDSNTPSLYIRPMGRVMIDTGLCIELPKGYEAQIRPRSGLALKSGIVCQLGTIDSDYRGRIGIIIINFSDELFKVDDGDRVAQMVITKVERCEWEKVDKLDDTDRGDGGFGHTGV